MASPLVTVLFAMALVSACSSPVRPPPSASAIEADSQAITSFTARLDAVDVQSLSLEAQLDLDQTKHTLDGMSLRNDVIRPWAKDAFAP